MVDDDKAPGAGTPAIGRFVTVSFRGAPSGLVFELLGQVGSTLRLKPLLASGALPFDGERVDCQSSIGRWTTTTLSSRDGVLELAAPTWLARVAQRRSRRIALDEAVNVHAGERDWAGRLSDVSMKGAAVVLERSAGVRPGDPLRLDVGGGSIQATVRSVRPDTQRRLHVVLGVAFDRLEPAALRWVAGAVAGRRPGSGQAPPARPER